MKEIELTFLAKEIPSELKSYSHKEITDFYTPNKIGSPSLRIRKEGDKCYITKKEVITIPSFDCSVQNENNISIDELEFKVLTKNQSLLKLRKLRYYYENNGVNYMIDIFADELQGLVLVEVEFLSEQDRDSFRVPDFCLKDVTNEKTIAGGMLAGKSYREVKEFLDSYGYKKFF